MRWRKEDIKAGSKDYGAITAVLGYYGETRRLFKVPAGCFLPAPKVDSAVIRIDLYSAKKYQPKDEKLFFKLIKAAFSQRRKTLVNALSSSGAFGSKEDVMQAIETAGLDKNIRGEALSINEFCILSDIFVNN